MTGPISDGSVTQGGDTLLRVAVAGAAALHYQVVNGKMSGGKRIVCGGEVFGLARARLMLQQANSDVGDFQLLLTLVSKRIQGLPLWKAAVDHLWARGRDQTLQWSHIRRWSLLYDSLGPNRCTRWCNNQVYCLIQLVITCVIKYDLPNLLTERFSHDHEGSGCPEPPFLISLPLGIVQIEGPFIGCHHHGYGCP